MLGPPPGEAAALKAAAMEAAAAAAAASANAAAGSAASGHNTGIGANPFLAAPEGAGGAKQRRPSRHVVLVREPSGGTFPTSPTHTHMPTHFPAPPFPLLQMFNTKILLPFRPRAIFEYRHIPNVSFLLKKNCRWCSVTWTWCS